MLETKVARRGHSGKCPANAFDFPVVQEPPLHRAYGSIRSTVPVEFAHAPAVVGRHVWHGRATALKNTHPTERRESDQK